MPTSASTLAAGSGSGPVSGSGSWSGADSSFSGPAPHGKLITWHGVKTVARLELIQRVRSSRWKVALLLWFLGVGAVCLLVSGALTSSYSFSADTALGPMLFGINTYFILFMGLLITPTLASTSINGDRSQGTLAILQASLLNPMEITLGKLAASWISAMAFLVVSIPFIIWSLAAGGVALWSVVAVIIAMAFVLLVVCAVSLYMSARMAKTSASTVMSYLYVAFISGITVLLMVLGSVVISHDRVTREMVPSEWSSSTGNPTACTIQETYGTTANTGATWWLLAPNPFVIVADASTVTGLSSLSDTGDDPLAAVASVVRQARSGYTSDYNAAWCRADGTTRSEEEANAIMNDPTYGGPVWPLGILINVVIGAGAIYGTYRRLKAPYKQLPKGVRIA